jgi:hypothetical protein
MRTTAEVARRRIEDEDSEKGKERSNDEAKPPGNDIHLNVSLGLCTDSQSGHFWF